MRGETGRGARGGPSDAGPKTFSSSVVQPTSPERSLLRDLRAKDVLTDVETNLENKPSNSGLHFWENICVYRMNIEI